MTDGTPFDGLPGAEWVIRGLDDAHAGRWTPEALTVAIAPTRLRDLGLDLPNELPESPEHTLYELLQRNRIDDAYGRYNALRRELDSFVEALESRRLREHRV